MTATATTFEAYRMPPFEVEMTHEDIIICDDDRCAHNSHPSGVTLYTLIGVQIDDRGYDEDYAANTSTITLPDGERWWYWERWEGNPYPTWTLWQSATTREKY